MKWIFFLIIVVQFYPGYTQKNSDIYYQDRIYFKVKDNSGVAFKEFDKNSQPSYFPILSLKIDHYGITAIQRPFKVANSKTLRNTYVITFDSTKNIDSLISDFQNDPNIEYAEKVPIMRSFYEPDDEYASNDYQWALTNIEAYEAWDIYKSGGDEVVIAIVDDAVQWEHEDLKANLWVNIAEYNGVSNIDDDGNGYIDDIIGWDAANNDNNPAPPSYAEDYIFSHGTHCAGIAAGVTDNEKGIASPSFNNAKIMACKGKIDGGTDSNLEMIWPAFKYAVINGADIISCSWGGDGYSTTQQNIINWAWDNGSIVVASAGNDDSDSKKYPAAYNNVISVANTDPQDKKWTSSNYGSWIDISAPGSAILSSVATTNSSYQYYWGTSMSCPLVSSALALMISFDSDLDRNLLIDCLLSSTDYIDHVNPEYADQLGSGRLNVKSALACMGSSLECNAPLGLNAISGSYSHMVIGWEESGADAYQTRIRKMENDQWTEGGWTSSTSRIWANMTPCTEYEFQVRSRCDNSPGGFSTSSYFDTGGCTDDYCYSYGLTFDNWIDKVTIGSIDNLSGNNFGYQNYTSISTELTKGDSYEIILDSGMDNEIMDVYWQVWIDLNQDNAFDDNEKVFSKVESNLYLAWGDIEIPTSSKSGSTRMRVSMSLESDDSPCAARDNREVEDYSVIIKGIQETLTLVPSNKTIENDSQQLSFTVDSNVDWEILNVSDTWFSASISGTSSVVIEINENTSIQPRTGQVTIQTMSGGQSRIFTLTQNGVDAYLTVDKFHLTFPSAGDSLPLVLTGNVSWTATENVTWLSLNDDSGHGNYEIIVQCDENTSLDVRQTIVTIHPDGLSPIDIIVLQSEGIQETLTLVPSNKTIENDSQQLSFTVDSNVDWEILNVSDTWFSASISGTSSVVIEINENTSIQPRTGQVTIQTMSGGQSRIFTLTQNGVDAYLTVDKFHLTFPSAGDSLPLVLTGNVSWTASENVTWLNLNDDSGHGNYEVIVQCDENTSLDVRQTIVTIHPDGLSPIDIIVLQSAGEEVFEISQNYLEVSYNKCSHKVSVTSPNDWIVNTSADWIGLSPPWGPGNRDVYLEISENEKKQSRSTFVVFSNSSGEERSLTVVQEGAIISSTNDDTLEKSLIIYPNPTSRFLHIKSKGIMTGQVHFSLYDVSGKSIIHERRVDFGGSDTYAIDLRDILNGIYYLSIVGNHDRLTKKIVIAR